MFYIVSMQFVIFYRCTFYTFCAWFNCWREFIVYFPFIRAVFRVYWSLSLTDVLLYEFRWNPFVRFSKINIGKTFLWPVRYSCSGFLKLCWIGDISFNLSTVCLGNFYDIRRLLCLCCVCVCGEINRVMMMMMMMTLTTVLNADLCKWTRYLRGTDLIKVPLIPKLIFLVKISIVTLLFTSLFLTL